MISYVTALSVAVFVLLALTNTYFSYDFFNAVNDELETELDFLQSLYDQGGKSTLEYQVSTRKSIDKFDKFSYILVDQNKEKISGDLKHWPAYKEWSDGWLSFAMSFEDWQGEQQSYNFLARSRELKNGEFLMVARIADDVRQNIELVGSTLLWGMIIMIILGVIGGIVVSVMSLQRVETINDTIRTIMSGNLSNRIPVHEPLDDFSRLSHNLNQMLDRIEDAVDDVRQVTNNIAHDLRTPLTRLRNKLSTLEKRSAPQNTEMIREMLAESDDLLATFNALLRIAQIESGVKRENFSDVNLSLILHDVVELYEPLAVDKGLHLSTDIAEDVHLQGDKDLLFQMLANLMDNAIKYTPENESVAVSLHTENQHAVLQFADTGPGIPEEKYKKVFQRFYRVEASRGVSPGNGLGLSLVKAVAKLHRGRIRLNANQPRSENKGLKLTITVDLNA
jgi:signal transduction histidine kinase